MSLPSVSVIIPTYLDWSRLQLCLDLLENQTYPKNIIEIIVVNNKPDSPAPKDLKLPQNCRLLNESKPGSYAARNLGISQAKGEILAFTDSDCQPQSDWIEQAIDFFTNNPECDRIGGNIKMIVHQSNPSWAELYEKAFAFRQEEFVEFQGMAATGNMLSKKRVFDEIGLFNEQLMSGGDSEWGKRASENGFTLRYVKECIVWHPTRSKLAEIKQKAKREAGGHLALRRKSGTLVVIVEILLCVIPPIKSLKKILYREDLSTRDKIIAFTVRYYLRFVSSFEKIKLLLGKSAERR